MQRANLKGVRYIKQIKKKRIVQNPFLQSIISKSRKENNHRGGNNKTEDHMEEKPNYYSIIPADVRYNKRLKANEKLLYSEITALTGTNGKCWASNKYFADLYETSEETISRYIKNIADAGYVDIEYEKNGSIVKNRFIRLIKQSTAIDKKINGTIDENIKENNTSINNKKENRKETHKEKLTEFVEAQLGRTINALEFEIIETWEDIPATRNAIIEAVKRGGRSVQYMQKVIQNKPKTKEPEWMAKEITEQGDMDQEEIEDFQNFIEEFRNEK